MKTKKNIIKIVVTAIIAVTLLASSTAVMTAATGSGYIETPQITGFKNTGNGVEIRWNRVAGAEMYRVFYYGRNGWTGMYDTTSTSYVDTDVRRDCRYTYTVRCISADKSRYTSDYNHNGKMIQYSLYPYLTNAESTDNGVRLSWRRIDGINDYRVFYYGRNGWTRLCDTTANTVLDSDVRSGKNYLYTVRAITPNGSEYISGYDSDGIRIKYLSTPQITDVDGQNNGIKISWNKVAGAEMYRVFYYGRNGWTGMYDTTSTSYVDTDVRRDCRYTYTVRCISADKSRYTSDYNGNGFKIYYTNNPKISVRNTENGVNISWDKVTGADTYRVFYYGRNGWTRLCDTNSTSVTDSDVYSGKTYTYTVRCITADKKQYTSGYNANGVKIQYIATPQITGFENTTNGVKISWNKVDGAEMYRVFYYGRNGWTGMYDTTSTSYVDRDVRSGKTYTYTVRCINSSKSRYTSDYHSNWQTTYYAPPTIKSITRTSEGVNVSWDKASGVASYRLYRTVVGGTWEVLTTTTETSYIDTITANGTYKYALRYVNDNGKLISAYTPSEAFTYAAEQKYYDAVYKTVHHDAEFAKYWVVDNEAYSYEEPVYKDVDALICKDCGCRVDTMTDDELYEHISNHMDNHGKGGYYSDVIRVQVGTETINVPEKGHYEFRQVKEAYDEQVIARPAGWYSEALESTTEYDRAGKKYYEAEYKTVRHNAEIKRVWVVDQEAGYRDIPIYEDRDVRKVCRGLNCGLDLTNMTDKEINEHHMQTKHTGWRYIAYPMQVGTIKVSVSEQGHYENKVIKEAYNEQVLVRPAGWYLDESKYKTYHEAEYKTVYKDAEFEDVTIIDKEAYTYEIPAYKDEFVDICKGCGCRVDTMTDEELDEHSINHMLNHEPGGYYSALIKVENGTRTEQASAVTHTDKKLIKPESNKRILAKESGWY